MSWFSKGLTDVTGLDTGKSITSKENTIGMLGGAGVLPFLTESIGESAYDVLGDDMGFKEKGMPGWKPDVSSEPQSYPGTPGTGGPRQWRSEGAGKSSTPASTPTAPASTAMSQDTFSGLLSALTGKEEKGPTSFSVQQGPNGGLQYKIDGMEDTPGGGSSQKASSQEKEEIGTAEDFEKLFGGA